MTNNQNRVLIALTKTAYPRTPDALSAELGMPKPSIRRLVAELRMLGQTIDGPQNAVVPGEYFLRHRVTMEQTETPTEAAHA